MSQTEDENEHEHEDENLGGIVSYTNRGWAPE